MNQAIFSNKESYVNWRRQFTIAYKSVSETIRSLKTLSRDMKNLTESERQQAGKCLNTSKCEARTMMISLDSVKMMYQLTHKELPPKRVKVKPSEEEINQRRFAKNGPMMIPVTTEETIAKLVN